MPIVRWSEPGDPLPREVRTTEPGRFVADLVARTGTEPTAVDIVRPSLEDIYLGLVAEHIDVAASAGAPHQGGMNHERHHAGQHRRPRCRGPEHGGMGVWRARFEIAQYVRSGDTVMFTFLFPILMLGLFAVAFGADGGIQPAPGLPPVPVAQMYLPAMLAAGLLLSGFQNLAIDIAVDRSEGVLKRLGGTPLSPVSYFLGKIVQVGVTGIAQAALLVGFAAVALQVPLPTDAARWFTFAWVFVLGIIGSALLGVALSSVPRSSRSAWRSSSRSASSCSSSPACTSSSTCSPIGSRRQRALAREVDGSGDEVRLPARVVLRARAERGMEHHRRCDRLEHVARPRARCSRD